ncbi:diacylglycerol kinase family protein [Vibrio variabilis]|uniref:diacylglycerol kinase family protein n=1 Tax=Vibrio variabilis TaxID=990271 RepID=UPI000DD8474B|nr:diacylglycerol kinase family protein [Vibrio variabilis]
MKARLIINGKKAASSALRQAVTNCRLAGTELDVRVTWEHGDIARLCDEAKQEGFDNSGARLIIAGGDGTINEVVNAVMRWPSEQRPTLGIVPMGTANDFAKSCELPESTELALQVALTGSSSAVDVGRCDATHLSEPLWFANMLTVGFGAQVTAQTPVELKMF